MAVSSFIKRHSAINLMVTRSSQQEPILAEPDNHWLWKNVEFQKNHGVLIAVMDEGILILGAFCCL